MAENAVMQDQAQKSLNSDGLQKQAQATNASDASAASAQKTQKITLTQSQVNYAVKYNKKANQAICKQIQTLVNVTADGSFGPITVNAIANWQAVKGLDPDGCFGPKSKAAAGLGGAAPVAVQQNTQSNANAGSNAGNAASNADAAAQADTTPIQADADDYTGIETINYGSSKKAAVTTMQKLLNKHGASIGVDGGFGPGTAKALMRFQYHYVKEDAGVYFRNTAGVKASCDAETWNALRQASPAAKNAPGVAIAFASGKKMSATPNTPLVTGGVMSANAAAKFNAMVAASNGKIKGVTSTFRGMTNEATVAATGGVGGSSGAIELYVDYGFNSARAATPGYSNHCIGNAADISGFGSRTAKPDVWHWLNAHASEYDFVPYSYETWHWNYKSNS